VNPLVTVALLMLLTGADTPLPSSPTRGAAASASDTIPTPAADPDTLATATPAADSDTMATAAPTGPPLRPDSDLAIRIRARGEFGGDWTQFRPCDAGIQGTCNPDLVPQLQPDLLLGVQAGGGIADRIFLDVDYDQTREFAGANRFRAFYQGREGELLQRVEVGDVTFALPETRFLTRGIPAGNFGVLARGQVTGVELQTVFAQQQGARRSREFRLGGQGGEVGIIQGDSLVLDDAEYVQGQFFFLMDPTRLQGAPHLDVLSLRPADAPPELAPGPEPIQLYRMERDPVLRQQVEGYIQADAVAEGAGGVVRESGWFRHLRPGIDYYLHPSGLWVALRSPLRPDEALAVTYRTALGAEVGDYNPEALANRGEVPTLELLRASRSQHQPGRATWDREMKQVYRISGSDEVDPGSVDLRISLGEESGGRTFLTAPDGRRIPLLRLLGLDESAPVDQVDSRVLFQPGQDLLRDVGLQQQVGLQGTFLVFPTLRPFMEPPPVPSEGLDAEGARGILGADANRRIYETVDPLEREAAGLFRLNLTAEVRSLGVTTTVALGAFGIREGSERIYLGDRLLQPAVDYILDPGTGVLTLLQPGALLARTSSDRLQVSWEQAAVFRIAPTSIVGASASLPAGGAGRVEFMGLYQLEQERVNRPLFGAEPASLGMVGVRSALAWELPGVDGFLQRFHNGSTEEVGAHFRMDGEVAVSLPNPNVSGDAYLDDFNAGNERTLSLVSSAWQLGSRPAFRRGAEEVLPAELDAESVGSLVWQHTWVEEGVAGDSLGIFEGFLSQDEVDQQIGFAGSQTRETGLRLTFGREEGPGAFPDGPRWRSVTTLISPTGADLTQTEYLDLYVADGADLTLVFDLGLVSEDAFFVDAQGRTSGIHPRTGRPWGQGVLDQEADPLRGEVWGPEADARGVWPEECRADPGRVYRLGDPRANCTRGNGRRDSEDLNQNGVLDTEERYIRYVLTLGSASPYLVRDRAQTGTRFRLYRIPLRGPLAINPGGAFTEADWRNVQFLRLTVAGTRPGSATLARMRLVGSRWVKRGVDGVLRGMGGDTLSAMGTLEVTPVSVLTEGGAYRAPPGVLAELDDPGAAVGGRGVEFNERSLALRYDGLGGGDRAEVYLRFLQRPRNFLNYSRLRVWALARRGAWGEGVPTDFFLKVGSDTDNFYLYRSRLTPAADPQAVVPDEWRPEHRIEFDTWIELRREAEERLLMAPPGPGDPPVEVWSADSTYAVVLRDRARAPNLAAVREISMGVWNQGPAPVDGEVWINELRLGGGLRTPSAAQVLNLEFDGGGLFQLRLGYTGQGADFQQLDEARTFQSDALFSMGGTLQAGRFLPGDWGVELPVTVSHQSSSRDPFFLEGTDLRGDFLPGLRAPGFSETRVAAAVAGRGETGVGWVDRLLPGADLRFSLLRSTGTTVTSETAVRGSEVGAGYAWRPDERSVGLIPGALEPVARVFLPPGWLRSLRETRVRWTPVEVRMVSGLGRRERVTTRFDQLLVDPADPGFTERGLEHRLDNSLRVELNPLESLRGSLDFRAVRDLLDPEDGVRDPVARPLVAAERRSLLGQNLGWETGRTVEGRVSYRPPLPDWIRADLGVRTRYRADRNAGLFQVPGPRPGGPAGEGELLRNVGADRDLRANLTVEPSRLVDGLSRLSPITVSLQDGVTAWFYREPIAPGAGLQLGLARMGTLQEMDGIPATTLVDRTGVTAGSGLRLPGSLFINVNVQETRVGSLDARAERTSRVRSWPDLRLGVSDLPLPGSWEGWVERVTLSTGWQRIDEEVEFGQAILQRRSRSDLRVPVEVVVEWGGGFATRYRGLLGRGEGVDPTGTTERLRRDHGVSVETVIAPQAGLGGRMQEPLRFALILDWSETEDCRVTTAQDRCVAFLSRLDRSVNLAVNTRLSDMEVGGRVALNDRRSFVGLQTGATQFQMGIWARMVFSSGPAALLGRPVDPF